MESRIIITYVVEHWRRLLKINKYKRKKCQPYSAAQNFHDENSESISSEKDRNWTGEFGNQSFVPDFIENFSNVQRHSKRLSNVNGLSRRIREKEFNLSLF